MTAIVGVLNAQGIAIAADSALTVSGGNIRKVYNKSNKIFTLSKYHPVGIAIYNNASFMGIPLETLIKMYRKNLKDKGYDTLEEYKTDFLKFLIDSIKFVSKETKTQCFYELLWGNYNTIHENIVTEITAQIEIINKFNPDEQIKRKNEIAELEIKKYFDLISTYHVSKTFKIEPVDFEKDYKVELESINEYVENKVKEVFVDVKFNEVAKNLIVQTMLAISNLNAIFESSCGLIFTGFGEMEVYPSSKVVTVGYSVGDKLRYNEENAVSITPGIMNAQILPYVQGDVTFTVLTGIDPSYKSEIDKSITIAFKTIAEAIKPKINDAKQSEDIEKLINKTSTELISQLEDYKVSTVTKPLLDTLVHMGKEDMAELAESLVNITSLKRRFSTADPSDESVGGPVDVAIITKGDGFIWMKRKHYFDVEINKGFLNKYFS